MWNCFFLIFGILFGCCTSHEEGGIGSFWQWTDIHLDPWYHASQESCNMDISTVGKYGDFECDSPWDLAKSSVDAMVNLKGGKDVDFILWSGDNVPHVRNSTFYNEKVNIDFIMTLTRNLTDIISTAFPGKLVFPLLGNLDIYPKNQFPANGGEFYNRYLDIWKQWINTTDAQTTFRRGGYYSLMINVEKNIRGVALNNNFYMTANQLTQGMDDPAGQFAWLNDVLDNSRVNGEKVYLFMHIPTGKVPIVHYYGKYSWNNPDQNTRLVNIITDYSDVILGIFSGHSHHDIYKLFMNDDRKPVSAMFVSPSITPMRAITSARGMEQVRGTARNPALRMITFKKATYELVDIIQYSMDLVEANRKLKTEWKLVYTFSDVYGVENVSIPQLYKALQESKKFDSRTFADFHRFYTVATDHYGNKPICDCDCKTKFLCSVEYQIYDEWDQCYNKMKPCHDEPIITGSGTLKSPLMFIYALLIILIQMM